LENIFPHNESEIAQCEAAYGEEFAKCWLLNNMVTIDGTKMGKSMGNSLNIQQVFSGDHPRLSQGYSPFVVRFFILSSHYRQNTDFSDAALQSATKGYQRLINTVTLVRQKLAGTPVDDSNEIGQFSATIEEYKTRFLEAMDNDFNTPQALATLFDFNKAVNSLLNSGQPIPNQTLQAIDETYQTLGGNILGIIPMDGVETISNNATHNIENELIRVLVDMRTNARKNKDYATSDAIRNQLAEIGVILEDRPDGTAWRIDENTSCTSDD
jgi:cysteinyl-tRNA synthetase